MIDAASFQVLAPYVVLKSMTTAHLLPARPTHHSVRGYGHIENHLVSAHQLTRSENSRLVVSRSGACLIGLSL